MTLILFGSWCLSLRPLKCRPLLNRFYQSKTSVLQNQFGVVNMINTWDELETFLADYLAKNPDVADSVLELILYPPNDEIALLIQHVWNENPLF